MKKQGKRPTYGSTVKRRVKRLLEALLAFVNGEIEDGDSLDIQVSKDEQKPIFRTKLRVLVELTGKYQDEGKLTIEQVREALKRLQDFLRILEDLREHERGSENWHFKLKLWHKYQDQDANLRQFDQEWDNRRSAKSKAVASESTSKKTPPTPTPYENLKRRGILNQKKFIGRRTELDQLHQLLQQNTQVAISFAGAKAITAAVTGMGGVGKTELAIQYARKHLPTYPGGVCWLSARDFAVQLVEFARPRFFPAVSLEKLSLAEQVAYCWQNWVEGDVLLVLDDVTNYQEQVEPYLPESSRFKFLITTRKKLGEPIVRLDLDVLKPLAAMALLQSLVGRKRLQQEPWVARRLCKWLGYLPLGLELVGRYLTLEKDLSLAELLEELQGERLAAEALVETHSGMTAQLGVAAAFELSWKRLNQNAQVVAYLLSLFALAPIPWSLVKSAATGKKSTKELKQARRALIQLNLLKRTDENTYQLHQLIREFLSDKREQSAEVEELKHGLAAAMVGVARQIPYPMTLELVEYFQPAIPHLEEVVRELMKFVTDEDLIRPYTGLGYFYHSQGFYDLAEPWYQECKAVAETSLGSEHPDFAINLNNLAALNESQGRYTEAESLYKQVIRIDKRSLPKDHPALAIHLNNLAGLYRSQGRYSEAEPLYLEAIYIDERSLPPDHSSLGIHLSNLAGLYHLQGRYDEAEPLHLQAIDIHKRYLPENYPSLGTDFNNLAGLYHSQGRYSKAETLYEQAIAIDKHYLPKDHPNLARDLRNLAGLYQSQGRYSEAEPLYEQAIAIDKRYLPKDHPNLATQLNGLALLYYYQGHYSKAEPLYKQAIEIDKCSLPEDHPILATHLNNLAELYKSQGRYTEAEPLYVEAWEICDRSLGSEHPNTVTVWSNFVEFLMQVVNEEKESMLSEHPLVQKLLAMIKEE